MAEKKITVKIAKRTYPLTIDSAEESKVLGAVQLINDNINKLKGNYLVSDYVDLLAMSALEIALDSVEPSKLLNNSSNEKLDKIDCYYHDIEAQPNEPTKYSVRSVPTILLFKGGKLLGTKAGASSEKDMLEFINPHF